MCMCVYVCGRGRKKQALDTYYLHFQFLSPSLKNSSTPKSFWELNASSRFFKKEIHMKKTVI